MSAACIDLICTSPEETHHISQTLGAVLKSGDVILLTGPIGAGKTHFARGLIQSLLEVAEDVPSPTYTLVQVYDTSRGQVWHSDLYRLGDVSEIIELGLTAAFEDAICLIEWPDRLGDLTPPSALSLDLRQGAEDDTRQLVFSWIDESWTTRLKELWG